MLIYVLGMMRMTQVNVTYYIRSVLTCIWLIESDEYSYSFVNKVLLDNLMLFKIYKMYTILISSVENVEKLGIVPQKIQLIDTILI